MGASDWPTTGRALHQFDHTDPAEYCLVARDGARPCRTRSVDGERTTGTYIGTVSRKDDETAYEVHLVPGCAYGASLAFQPRPRRRRRQRSSRTFPSYAKNKVGRVFDDEPAQIVGGKKFNGSLGFLACLVDRSLQGLGLLSSRDNQPGVCVEMLDRLLDLPDRLRLPMLALVRLRLNGDSS